MRYSKFLLLAAFVLLLSACLAETDFPTTASPTPASASGNSVAAELKIVYINSNGNVELWTKSGAQVITTTGDARSVAVSPDGLYAAYLDSAGTLFLKDLNKLADAPRKLIAPTDLEPYSSSSDAQPRIDEFEFIPAKNQILMKIKFTEGCGGEDLYKVDYENSKSTPTRLLNPGICGPTHVSKKGNWVVIALPDELVLASTVNTNEYAIFDNSPTSMGIGARGGPDIVWIDDSTFYTITPTYRDGAVIGSSTVWRISVNNPTTPQVAFQFESQEFHPAFLSFNATGVLSVFDYGETNDFRYVKPGYTSNLFSFSENSLEFIAWRPPAEGEADSTCFAFWQRQADLNGQNERIVDLACLENGTLSTAKALTRSKLVSPGFFSWIDNSQYVYVTPEKDLVYEKVDQDSQVLTRFTQDFPTSMQLFDFTGR